MAIVGFEREVVRPEKSTVDYGYYAKVHLNVGKIAKLGSNLCVHLSARCGFWYKKSKLPSQLIEKFDSCFTEPNERESLNIFKTKRKREKEIVITSWNIVRISW